MKILNCSLDKNNKFSDYHAKVSVDGVLDTIKNHYENSKVYLNNKGEIINATEMKKNKPFGIQIRDFIIPLEYGKQYYKLLWFKYLKTNNQLEDILEQYEDYTDIYDGKDHCCPSDAIRAYMQDIKGIKYNSINRGKQLYKNCEPLVKLLNGTNNYIITNGDIFNGIGQIIGHQVNAQGKMGSGIALTIKDKYNEAYIQYIKLFKEEENLNKMGICQIIKCKNKYIANIFGQEYYGRNKNKIYTDYLALEKGLTGLKNFAKENNLIPAVPFKIGCGLANGDWNTVLKIINKVFKDYYVLIYAI